MAVTKADQELKVAELEAQVSSDTRTIFERILAVADEVGAIELEKTGGVPFAYRGVDRVVGKLSPLLNKHGVFVVPVETIQILEGRDAANKVLTKADVNVKWRFYGKLGDFVEASTPGQADDFADRSTAQAMSVAFRILLLQTFHIPAFGNEEEDSEATAKKASAGEAKVAQARAAAPNAAQARAVESMRAAIVAAAGKKGWDGKAINEYAEETLGLTDWFDNPDKLNTILTKINEAPA